MSYQHSMGSVNRLEAGVGWSAGDNHSYSGLAGVYHWSWNITDKLNWY
ncbi:MAG: hypothetical protein OCD01_15965 [Fibrobacterales bacterium]